MSRRKLTSITFAAAVVFHQRVLRAHVRPSSFENPPHDARRTMIGAASGVELGPGEQERAILPGYDRRLAVAGFCGPTGATVRLMESRWGWVEWRPGSQARGAGLVVVSSAAFDTCVPTNRRDMQLPVAARLCAGRCSSAETSTHKIWPFVGVACHVSPKAHRLMHRAGYYRFAQCSLRRMYVSQPWGPRELVAHASPGRARRSVVPDVRLRWLAPCLG